MTVNIQFNVIQKEAPMRTVKGPQGALGMPIRQVRVLFTRTAVGWSAREDIYVRGNQVVLDQALAWHLVDVQGEVLVTVLNDGTQNPTLLDNCMFAPDVAGQEGGMLLPGTSGPAPPPNPPFNTGRIDLTLPSFKIPLSGTTPAPASADIPMMLEYSSSSAQPTGSSYQRNTSDQEEAQIHGTVPVQNITGTLTRTGDEIPPPRGENSDESPPKDPLKGLPPDLRLGQTIRPNSAVKSRYYTADLRDQFPRLWVYQPFSPVDVNFEAQVRPVDGPVSDEEIVIEGKFLFLGFHSEDFGNGGAHAFLRGYPPPLGVFE